LLVVGRKSDSLRTDGGKVFGGRNGTILDEQEALVGGRHKETRRVASRSDTDRGSSKRDGIAVAEGLGRGDTDGIVQRGSDEVFALKDSLFDSVGVTFSFQVSGLSSRDVPPDDNTIVTGRVEMVCLGIIHHGFNALGVSFEVAAGLFRRVFGKIDDLATEGLDDSVFSLPQATQELVFDLSSKGVRVDELSVCSVPNLRGSVATDCQNL